MTGGQSGSARDGQAADFVARVNADDAHESDWLALEGWLAADPLNLAAYERAEALWAELGEAALAIAGRLGDDEAPAVIDFTARRDARPRPARWIGAGIAATVAAFVVLGAMLLTPKTETYQTAAGETRTVALSDGSTISLNGASSLTVRMGRRERRVVMANAEAAFDVAHVAGRPFLVEVGDREVRVVGTEFNIARHAASTVVTVRRGVVEVRSAGSAAERLTPGRQLIATDGSAARVAAVNPEQAFAWRGGRLVYENRPLSEVAADLSRRFATPVAAAPDAAGIRFTGVLVLDNEAAVIGRLEALALVSAVRTADGITLRSQN